MTSASCENHSQQYWLNTQEAVTLANVTAIESVSFRGYLEKQAQLKTWVWRRYWFVLEDGQLAYFCDETLVEGRGLIDLGQALTIRALPPGSKNFSLEVSMKNKNHVLCAESEELRDQWVSYLQQAKLLRPRRTPSMTIARCNSISSDEEGLENSDIMKYTDFSYSGTTISPSIPEKSPKSPNSPHSPVSPLFGANKKNKNKVNSPKLTKPPTKSSSPLFGFLTSPTNKSSPPVMLKNVRPINQNDAIDEVDSKGNLSPKKTETKDEIIKKRAANVKVEARKTPVSRVVTRPPIDIGTTQPTNNNYEKNNLNKRQTEATSILRNSPLTQAKSLRPVSSPGTLSRSKPVSKERPHIVSRYHEHVSSSESSSDETETPPVSNVTKTKLERRTSGQKKDLVSKQSSGAKVVLRRAVEHSKSMSSMVSSIVPSDSEESDSDTNDNVFSQRNSTNDYTTTEQSEEFITQQIIDKCCERLSVSLKSSKPPIKDLPHPRLELTFRSVFDDIRLFLANNRGENEIYPIPRQSERGGKAISKLDKFLQTL